MSWNELADAEPGLARFGTIRLDDRVAYLATVRRDGSPRVHPVTPRLRGGRIFVRMYPSSPKVADLLADDRYALHSLVTRNSGDEGEFAVRGTAAPVRDAATLALVHDGPGDSDRYVVFELHVEEVLATTYPGERTERRRWRSGLSGRSITSGPAGSRARSRGSEATPPQQP